MSPTTPPTIPLPITPAVLEPKTLSAPEAA
jgi:hypothetical protein